MKKQLIILVIILLSALMLNADNIRGLTTKELNSHELKCVGHLPSYEPSSIEGKEKDSIPRFDNRDWELIDSLNIDMLIHAKKYWGVEYSHYTHTLSVISNHDQLIEASWNAIEKAPIWIRADLKNILSQLSELKQLIWAELINDAEDPYIDEIAFSVAHSSVGYLSSEFSYPELFAENAELIYGIDADLSYVEVLDYGSSSTDDNYYSTTRYLKKNENEETVEVEVPREIYYMYIVLPKITDEIAAYIDPSIIEQNSTHQNNIVDPPTGVFWRNYLYNHNDTGYPLLKDALLQCTVAWDGSLGTDNAIGAVNDWIRESLEFTSNSERPHQPVRIYKKHIGRCGEHADFTTAACRIALMPCASILAMSGDHTWNEFWDERWVSWEPVNNMVDVPLTYENGWGWSFGSVFEIRSDGLLTPVTATYSEGASTIVIYALDGNGDPIDGAKIMLAVASGTSIYVDNFGYTDNEGKYTFIVGEGKTYYARMDSDIGSNPSEPNNVSLVVDNTIDGQTYTNSFNISGIIQNPDFTQIDAPVDDVDDYKLIMDFAVPNQIIHGNIIMDDIDNTEFYSAIENGKINLFMTDLINYGSYSIAYPFDTFNCIIEANEGNSEFNISVPVYGTWYSFFDNSNNLNNPQHITGSIKLYHYDSSDADENEAYNVVTNLRANYPNPFNPSTTINFSLAAKDAKDAKIEIFNIKGQKIKTFSNFQINKSPNQEIVWNGTDDSGKPVSSGIYFYKLLTKGSSQTKRMILMK